MVDFEAGTALSSVDKRCCVLKAVKDEYKLKHIAVDHAAGANYERTIVCGRGMYPPRLRDTLGSLDKLFRLRPGRCTAVALTMDNEVESLEIRTLSRTNTRSLFSLK